ncbi:MAG: hypothetical protein NTX34_07410 [Cytophagales bacterium]|nr:hypothetical protein [Cytophagales bacterium]
MKKSKMSGENEKATMGISTLFVAVNVPEIYIVMSEKRMKKLKMSGENEITTMSISTLFVAVNLSEIYTVMSEKLK